MELYFEQLKQPLRLRQNSKAIEITKKLTSNRIPDGVVFPENNKDWSNLMYEDINIGQYLLLPNKKCPVTKNGIFYDGEHRIGQVRRLNPIKEEALLSFMDETTCLMEQKWIPVGNLKFIVESRFYRNHEHNEYEQWTSLEKCEKKYLEVLSDLANLKIRKLAKFLLAKKDLKTFEIISNKQFVEKIVFGMIFDNIELFYLRKLGEIEQKKENTNFEKTVLSLLKKSFGQDFLPFLIQKFESAVIQIDNFGKKSYTLSTKSVPEMTKKKEFVIKMGIDGAVGLVIIFSKKSFIDNGENFLSFYGDEECTNLIASYFPKNNFDSVEFPPLFVRGDRCWAKGIQTAENCIGFKIAILPISKHLGMSFWLANFILESIQDENKIGVCFELLQICLKWKLLEKAKPSPIKNAFVNLCSILIYKIKELKNDKNTKNEIFNENQNLQKLGLLYEEMNRLFSKEFKDEYTEYLQQ
ncbi:hypothetical protein MHBO_002391, partial [Bonamia ostreae]